MPKKSRRAKARHLVKSTKEIQRRQRQQVKATMAEPQPPTGVSPVSAKALPKLPDSAGRYPYVMAEVRFIGILAGAIVLVLIALSFILG